MPCVPGLCVIPDKTPSVAPRRPFANLLILSNSSACKLQPMRSKLNCPLDCLPSPASNFWSRSTTNEWQLNSASNFNSLHSSPPQTGWHKLTQTARAMVVILAQFDNHKLTTAYSSFYSLLLGFKGRQVATPVRARSKKSSGIVMIFTCRSHSIGYLITTTRLFRSNSPYRSPQHLPITISVIPKKKTSSLHTHLHGAEVTLIPRSCSSSSQFIQGCFHRRMAKKPRTAATS